MRSLAPARVRVLALVLGLAAALASVTILVLPHPALAAGGPDPTLVVGSVPDASSSVNPGDVVQAFDSATNAELGPTGGVPVGSDPYAIAITPDGSTAFVANNGSGTVTPVNVPSLSTQTNLCLPIGSCFPHDTGTQPEAVAVTPDGSAAYVANSGENSITEITIHNGTAKVASPQISSGLFSYPDALAISPDGNTLWVANYSGGTVVPVSLPGGKVGTPINVGLDPTALAITPDGRHLLVANSGDGTVTDIAVGTPGAPNTFALEPAQTGFVSPQALAIAPDGKTAYVTDTSNNVVVPVTIASDTPGSPVSSAGSFPTAVVVSPDNTKLYVANRFSDEVAVFSLSGGVPSLSGTFAVNGSPTSLAITPDQAPKASFSITPGTAGSPSSFDASASTTTPPGGTLTYTWSFGDGSSDQTTSNPVITHTYATPGMYAVKLTVTDAAGTSTTVVFTGQTVSRNGGPSAATGQTFAVQSPSAGAGAQAIVSGSAGTATPVALNGGPPPSATPGPTTGVGGSPSAVAIDPTGTTAYVVDTGSNQVTPVDMATGQAESPAKWISVGSEPDAIAITPNGRYAYVVNGGSTSVTRITLQTHATTTISVPAAGGANLDGIAITPDGKTAYVLDAANNTITPINLQTDAVGSPVGGSGLLSPNAIGIAPDGKTAYVVDGGSATAAGGVTTVDITGATPAPTSTVKLGSAGDHPDAIAISPNGGAAYVVDAPTNGDTASVTPLSLSGGGVTVDSAANVSGASALFAIAVTPDGKSAYATGTTQAGSVIVPIAVTGTSATPATPAGLSSAAHGIAIAPDEPPVAELAVTSPVAAGAPDTFDASASSNPSSPIASYAFAFGDGATTTTTAPTDSTTHAYTVAGVYTATVTETDQAGTSTTQVYTGQTMSRNGSQIAVASQTVTVYPTVTGVSPISGAAGSKVTITGTGFDTTAGSTTVDFGTAAATDVSCSSSTKCTATAPTGKGTVDITVTVGGQTSPVNAPADQFTYSSGGGGGPTVTSISPTSGPAGSSVTILGTGFSTTPGATTVHFGTVLAMNVSCSSTTRCSAQAPFNGSGTVDITVTVAGQTSPATAADRFTFEASSLG